MDLFLNKRMYTIDKERATNTYYHPNGKPMYRIIHLIHANECKMHHILVGDVDKTDNDTISFTSMIVLNKKAINILVSNYNDAHVILIVGRPSVQGQVAIEKQMDRINVEFIDPNIFHFDRSKFLLVPSYRVLTKHEVKMLLKKLHIKKTQFSHILRTDPIVSMYGYKPGQVLELVNEQLWRLVV